MNSHTELIERLEPCPFCGGEAEMYEGHRDHWKVRCTSCGALPGRWFAREGAQLKAVKLWNTRTNDQAISTLTAALRDAREAIASLDEDALGECVTSYDRHGNPEGWSLRDELLAKIDATLTKGEGDKPKWEHVLEDGSLDHEWVTESGVTFCAQCEAPKPETD